MLKRIILALSVLTCCLPAVADSWDSNLNIDRAMSAALKTYKSNGALGLVSDSKNCYAGLDTSRTNKNVGRDVEYCISFELSSVIIDREVSAAMSVPRNEYLSSFDVFTRAMFNLERARIVRQPEEFDRYLLPRFTKINAEIPSKM